MELRRYWAISRKWVWLIVLGTLLAAGVSYLVSLSLPPVYQASTTLFVSQGGGGSTMGPYYDLLTSERLTRTFAELVVKRPVLEKVKENLGLPYSTENLAATIKVNLVRDTQLLVVSVENSDPRLARDIANEVAASFIEQNTTMQVARSRELRRQLEERLAGLEQDMLSVSQAIEDLGQGNTEGRQSDMAKLKAALSQLQATYSSVLKSRGDLTVAETATVNSVSVAEPAVEPEVPIRPKPLQNVGLAALLGLLLSLGAALLLEYLDDTIKNPDDVEATTSLVTLGAIKRFDPDEAKSSKLLTKDYSKSPISEAYRVLRTNIQFSSLDRPLRSLLVTSANPLEGKSTTAANLAVVVAQTGKKVVLVDSDLRRTSLHHFFDVSNQQGLTNLLLADSLDGQVVLQATSVD